MSIPGGKMYIITTGPTLFLYVLVLPGIHASYHLSVTFILPDEDCRK